MKANLQYELRYYGFKNFTLHGGVGDYFKIMNLDSGTHQVHEQRINLGLSFYFPPKWEEFISGDFWSSMKVSKPHPQNNEVKRTGRKQE